MRLRRIASVSVVALLVSSCMVAADYAAQEAPLWLRADSLERNFQAERKVCVDAVELALHEESYVDPLFPMTMAGRRQAATEWARREYLTCMYEKGWQLAPGAHVGAPGEIYYP